MPFIACFWNFFIILLGFKDFDPDSVQKLYAANIIRINKMGYSQKVYVVLLLVYEAKAKVGEAEVTVVCQELL